jgi:hypothetical protein
VVTVARIAGRRGRVYIGIASGAEASALPFVATWAINFNTDKVEVTTMDDTTKVYVAGLPDASGTFSGFYDDATSQTYTAATDGLARKFYVYPSLSTATQYWFGTVLPDFQVDSDVAGAVKMSASWAAATPVAKVG